MNELDTILSTMDIPEKRKKDFRWLQRNLLIRNGKREQAARAMELIKEEIKKESQ